MIGYFQVLSEKEAVRSRAKHLLEMNEWWLHLSYEEKSIIYDSFEKVFKQMNCQHEFIDQKYYSKDIVCCKHCDWIKPPTPTDNG